MAQQYNPQGAQRATGNEGNTDYPILILHPLLLLILLLSPFLHGPEGELACRLCCICVDREMGHPGWDGSLEIVHRKSGYRQYHLRHPQLHCTSYARRS